jgi:hypothetical protein
MKIGRNQPCLCGSGKKYKKCCLDKEDKIEEDFSKGRELQLKGKNSEKFVQDLAQKSFLTDWCYPNPKLEKGKELCDLLVIFGNIAIIWQIKDLKRGKDGKYSEGEVEKNLRQLSGARRMLFASNKEIRLENPRRGQEIFNSSQIKEIYLISALVGEGEDYFEFVKRIKNKTIHVLDRESVEILLNELDTIKDFTDYLKEKEDFLSKDNKVVLMGGEKDLLSYYLMNERNFDKFKKADFITIEEGCWDELQKRPEYIAKKEEDRISYFWDFLIDKAHLSKDVHYELVAREMARLNRFKRRCNSKAFMEGHAKAHIQKNKNFYKRNILEEDITYCFLYADSPTRKARKNLLGSVCIATRGHFKQNQKVLGIATELKMSDRHSFEFCLLDFPEWTDVEEKKAEEMKNLLGIFKNMEMSRFTEDEYPKENNT